MSVGARLALPSAQATDLLGKRSMYVAVVPVPQAASRRTAGVAGTASAPSVMSFTSALKFTSLRPEVNRSSTHMKMIQNQLFNKIQTTYYKQ